MSEEKIQKEEMGGPGKGLIVFITVVLLGLLITLVVAFATNNNTNQATNNDIDGNWNSTLTTHSFVFIPKCNINGLEFTFSIRDKDGKELQQIVKKVGDVKKGQQYTVSFNVAELQDFATLMDSKYTKLTVTAGTKKLI